MIISWTLALLAQTGTQAPGPVRITVNETEIILRSGAKVDRVSLRPDPEPKPSSSPWPPERVLFRKDAAYAVWDSRGLTVRQGAWVFTSKLPEIPLSPKLFSVAEILATKEAIGSGRRSVNAAGPFGAVRDGSHVYFLMYWDEEGKPWFEALISVDLSEERPKPKLVGRFAAPSLDLAPGKSRLFVREDKVACWVKNEASWGLAAYNAGSNGFEFEALGDRPLEVDRIDDRIGWFTGKSDYGSTLFYRWDVRSLSRRELLETRGRVRLIDPRTPWIAVVHEEEGSFLQNLDTGGRLRLPANPRFRWCAFGVLVWNSATRPTRANLYDPERWAELGRWPAGR